MGQSTGSCARHTYQICQLCCCQSHPYHWQELYSMSGNAGTSLVVQKDIGQSRNKAFLLERSD